MGAINAFVFWRTRAHRLPLPRFSQILTTELVFLSVCTAIVIIKAFHPEIYQIERFKISASLKLFATAPAYRSPISGSPARRSITTT